MNPWFFPELSECFKEFLIN
ncbi:hypothetical protein [Salinimicrobium terrae]